jgi:hypothetical protein
LDLKIENPHWAGVLKRGADHATFDDTFIIIHDGYSSRRLLAEITEFHMIGKIPN